ncbi:hypothetical protein [Rhizobium etli]|uniref:hypothetical protein n=1 Tax=Rhizobium etli TaxID=29449 RepID=UPI000383A7A7|nr:hypothetical protein [Rhizobium etli]AGS20111.1 hypothetical protein REMIM1_CH00240 [Rhizobium etli bv. mimosae str. Mim1]
MATPVTLHMINDEPRVHDLELAARLGYARRAKIRELIKLNADELSGYGTITALEKTPEVARGRAVVEFFLNEQQAMRVATLADSIDTPVVCEMVAKAYAEHRLRRPSTPDQALDVAAVLSILQQMAETLAYLTKHMVRR